MYLLEIATKLLTTIGRPEGRKNFDFSNPFFRTSDLLWILRWGCLSEEDRARRFIVEGAGSRLLSR